MASVQVSMASVTSGGAALGSRETSLAYRPDIDGLRAVAVVPVILFHLDNTLFPAGYLGVDVFFVISGFLITSLLLREWGRTQTVSLVDFWRRRILRIVPALMVMVIATFCVGQLVLYAPERYDLSVNASAALLSVANLTHWLNYGSYWGSAAESSPLLHTWSLSVEEQYYLVYPLALLMALRYAKRWLFAILVLGLLASFATYLWGVGAKPGATFFLLPTRGWELAAGAVAAMVCFQRGVRSPARPAWAALGLLLVAAGYLLIRADGLSYFLWVPVLGSALLLSCNLGAGCITTRVLSFPLLVGIGKISYSLYLWHWPILLFSKSVGERYGVAIGAGPALLMILAASLLSYYLIEKPARNRPALVPWLLVSLAVLAATAFALRHQNISEPVAAFAPTQWEGPVYNVNPNQRWPESVVRRMAGIEFALAQDSTGAYAKGGIQRLYGGPTPEMVVFGDSHGLMWAPAIDAAARKLRVSVAFFTADGTPTFFRIPLDPAAEGSQFFSAGQKRDFDRARLAALREWRPKLVVIGARWSNYTPADAQDVLREVEAIGAKAILIGDAPYLDIGERNTPQYLAYRGWLPNAEEVLVPGQTAQNQIAVEVFSKVGAACGRCIAVPTDDIFNDRGKVIAMRDSTVFYIDDDHLSSAGAMLATERLVEATFSGQSGEIE